MDPLALLATLLLLALIVVSTLALSRRPLTAVEPTQTPDPLEEEA
jgi:hypothetical protein